MGLFQRFANVLRSNRLSRDIEREMAFHMAEKADDLVAGGMSEPDARREARRRFGNPSFQKERTRDVDVMTWLESLMADIRYAFRAMRGSPAFALVTIASLGLGIGANTAIFSLINAVVLKALPVSHPEELVQVTLSDQAEGTVFTNPIWEQVRDRQDMFSGVFVYGRSEFNLSAGGEVRRADGYWVSGDFFSTLGVRPETGRLIAQADDFHGCPPVAVLSYGFWQNEYGGSTSAIGRTILLDRTPHVIVGVADPAFYGVDVGRSVSVYVPLCLRKNLDHRSNWFLFMIGRPKPGVAISQLVPRLRQLSAPVFEATIPERWGPAEKVEYAKNQLSARPAPNGLSSVRREYALALNVLMVVVGLVLLIACANVANLLLARAAVRSREMAIRLAIGAARRRLVRQLLTESILLAGLGAVVGIVFAKWGALVLVRVLSGGPSPVSLDLAVDGRVLGFTLGIAVITGILFGLAPAWRSTRVDPQLTLKANGRGLAEGHTRFTVGKALVVGQIALSLVLVIGAGLLLGSFRKLTTFDPGFRRDGVLIVSATMSNAGYTRETYGTARRELLTRLRGLPGVQSAAASEITPLSGSSWNDFIKVDGYVEKSKDDALVYFNEVTDAYFATLGTPIIAGREFNERDVPTGQAVVIINESLARKFYGTASPIGKHLRISAHDSAGPPIEIVGVVRDAKYQNLREETLPTAYLAMNQAEQGGQYTEFVVRTAGPASALAASVKSTVAEMNRAIALRLTPMTAQVDATIVRDRLLATLSAFFGGLALLLAMVGLYGTLSYTVARRRNEIGIRIALGAAQSRVMRLVLGEVSRMVVIGIAVGAIVALASTRWVKSFLYGLTATDPVTIVGAAVTLAVVALAAGALPAWRASRVEPIAALRDE
jgi:predicted permease